jgi:hypothetical protein
VSPAAAVRAVLSRGYAVRPVLHAADGMPERECYHVSVWRRKARSGGRSRLVTQQAGGCYPTFDDAVAFVLDTVLP